MSLVEDTFKIPIEVQISTKVEDKLVTEIKYVDLSDPIILEAFTKFCERERSPENIEFLSELKDLYEYDPPLKNGTPRKTDLRRLYNQYINPESPNALNLKGPEIDDIKTALDKNETNSKIFDGITNNLFGLLGKDTMTRFVKQSQEYKEASELKALKTELQTLESTSVFSKDRKRIKEIHSILSKKEEADLNALTEERRSLITRLEDKKLTNIEILKDIQLALTKNESNILKKIGGNKEKLKLLKKLSSAQKSR